MERDYTLNLTEQEMKLIYRTMITRKHQLEEMFRDRDENESQELSRAKMIIDQIEKTE